MADPIPGEPVDTCDLFVDEAGVPEIFDRKGRVIVGTSGCSYYFLLGMLEVDDPEGVASKLTELREQMLADPYFATAESFKPQRKKTAVLLHAKDDLPDVRVKVESVRSSPLVRQCDPFSRGGLRQEHHPRAGRGAAAS